MLLTRLAILVWLWQIIAIILPIRRYPDTAIHRILTAFVNKKAEIISMIIMQPMRRTVQPILQKRK